MPRKYSTHRDRLSYARLMLLILVLFGQSVWAEQSFLLPPLPPSEVETLAQEPEEFIARRVADPYPFFGLASYLNAYQTYILKGGQLSPVTTVESLAEEQWLLVAGRFNVLLIAAPGLVLQAGADQPPWTDSAALHSPGAEIYLTDKSMLADLGPQFDQLRYHHLWTPLAWLARGIEALLLGIHSTIDTCWALSIFLMALVIRLLLTPINLWTANMQARVNEVQASLEPQLAQIRSSLEGEAAHNAMMEAHKALGVSPFYTLKPMFAMAVQLPVLIAVFNALAEMPQLAGQALWWITDLAYPDRITDLPFTLPLLGNTFSLLPVLMTVATLLATANFHQDYATPGMLKRQRQKLLAMSAAFLLLFYPFPAAMVYYWALVNVFTAIQQQVSRLRRS